MKPNLSLQTNHLLGLSDDELKWAIVNCLRADPCLQSLTLNGFSDRLTPEALSEERVELISPDSLQQIRDVALFLQRYATALPELPTPWHRRTTSYWAKHLAEHFIGGYVANGALILAAALCGVVFEQIEGTPNATLGLDLPPRPQPGGTVWRTDGPPPKAGRGDDIRRTSA